jgi:hypothetical protein
LGYNKKWLVLPARNKQQSIGGAAMPKLTVGGTEITGVERAEVRIIHGTQREPERLPIMEWDIILGLQSDDTLGKWALAPQGPDRFKRCELVIYNRDKSQAHTWTLLKAYVHEYREVEFPAGDTSHPSNQPYIRLLIRGTLLHPGDYDGTNVMTVAPGEKEALPG